VSPVKYEPGFYIPEDDILHNHCREDFQSYKVRRIPRAMESHLDYSPPCFYTLYTHCGSQCKNENFSGCWRTDNSNAFVALGQRPRHGKHTSAVRVITLLTTCSTRAFNYCYRNVPIRTHGAVRCRRYPARMQADGKQTEITPDRKH
jgi:hypothetical protein